MNGVTERILTEKICSLEAEVADLRAQLNQASSRDIEIALPLLQHYAVAPVFMGAAPSMLREQLARAFGQATADALIGQIRDSNAAPVSQLTIDQIKEAFEDGAGRWPGIPASAAIP